MGDMLSKSPIIGYGAFITCSLVFAFALLNCSDKKSPSVVVKNAKDEKNHPFQQCNTNLIKQTINNSNKPEPRWYILKRLNYLFVIGFVVSIVLLKRNATTYLNDPSTLLMFLIVWGAFLSYFFGFFGISFVDADEMIAVQQHQHKELNSSTGAALVSAQSRLV